MTRSRDLAVRKSAPVPGRRRAADFWSDRRANIAVGLGVMLGPLMLALGVAFDAANMVKARNDVQAALDSAALEIALHLNSDLGDEGLEDLGERFILANLGLEAGSPEAPTLDYLGMTTEPSGLQTLSVSAHVVYDYLVPRSFGGAAGGSSTTLQFRSAISSRAADGACVYALNHTAPRSIEAAGNTTIAVEGCVVASNSTAPDAVYVGGSATLSADCVQSSGGIEAGPGLVTDCAANREHAWRLPDPFAGLDEPMPPVLLANPKNSDLTVAPGRYRNLTLDGTKTLLPGLYYLDGDLTVKGDISGSGVTIFMLDGAIRVNASAALSLEAPREGDHAGMLFWAARANASSHVFNGNGATDLDGFLYFPSGAIDYLGNNATTSSCLRIVADTIKMSGSSTIESDCTEELGGREARVSGPLYFSK